MQADQLAAQVAADEASAATASCHAVLLSPDLWLELFQWLDRGSKVGLRRVSHAMCSQVDGSISVVVSPAAGFSPDSLSAALVRWPAVRDLTLVLAVGSTSDLAPLSTTSLVGLKSLAVRQVGTHGRMAHGRMALALHGCPMQLLRSRLPAAVNAVCVHAPHAWLHAWPWRGCTPIPRLRPSRLTGRSYTY